MTRLMRRDLIAICLATLASCLPVCSPASAAKLIELDPAGARQESPAQPNAAADDRASRDAEREQRWLVLRPYEKGSSSETTAAEEEKKDQNGGSDRSRSSDMPWIVAAMFTAAVGVTGFLTALSGLFGARSTHGVARGYIRIDDVAVRRIGGDVVLTCRIRVTGNQPVRGIRLKGWFLEGDQRWWLNDDVCIQAMPPGSHSIAVKSHGCRQRPWSNLLRRVFRAGVGAVVVAIYTDHADVTRRETRVYRNCHGALDLGSWNTRTAFSSIG